MLGTREGLRIGVIGVGAIGEWHARILAESPQAVLAAVCDRDGFLIALDDMRRGCRAGQRRKRFRGVNSWRILHIDGHRAFLI